MTVACRCNEVTELYGDEARDYIAQHLVRAGDFYECPDTGSMWEVDETDPARFRIVRAGRS